jgi:hypothetical protein
MARPIIADTIGIITAVTIIIVTNMYGITGAVIMEEGDGDMAAITGKG